MVVTAVTAGCVGATPVAPTPSAVPSTPPSQQKGRPAPVGTPTATPRITPRATPSGPPSIPASGPARYQTAKFVRPAPAGGAKRHIKVNVKVEQGVPYDPEEFAAAVAGVLQDDRSWRGTGAGNFDFVGEGQAQLTIYLLTPGTTDRRCAPLRTFGRVSCQQGNGVNLNAVRWAQGVPDFNGDLTLYRQYLVNHEVGHYLGYRHQDCPKKGAVAPVMMQQTKGLRGCQPNGWPANG